MGELSWALNFLISECSPSCNSDGAASMEALAPEIFLCRVAKIPGRCILICDFGLCFVKGNWWGWFVDKGERVRHRTIVADAAVPPVKVHPHFVI